LLCLLVCLFCSPLAFADAPADKVLYLSELDLTPMRQGWGKPQRDKSVKELPLSIAGEKFDKGVGTHANSSLWIKLDGTAETFSAKVGVDDGAGSDKATIIFQVYVDGKKAFDSGIMYHGDRAREVNVDCRGAKQMQLRVTDGADDGLYDHADWCDAKFKLTGDGKPMSILAPSEPRIRLTPPPSSSPRINGAKVFGVRPGSPFLFTIAATGDRPMTFAADNLPAGLSLDAKTGQISGVVANAGKYDVVLKATNALGAVESKFQIVCGDTLALTPHMGWNHWYTWTDRVTDQIIRDAADAMVSSGMINFGYQYVNIDDCWAIRTDDKDPKRRGEPRDSAGNIVCNAYFPDMKALTDYIHAKGLKAGIYTSPGPLTCAKYTGSYQHEAQDAKQFADWGFDFVKHDWCSYGTIDPKPTAEGFRAPYRKFADALKAQKRDMILNLCQYGMGDVWEWGREVGGHSWRTAGDIGGRYETISENMYRDVFGRYVREKLERFAGPGSWNDPDYLLCGYVSKHGKIDMTSLTPNEQYTQVSLWAIIAAPFIYSGDMTQLDDFTLGLLCNAEVIDVNQDSLAKAGFRVSQSGDLQVWKRPLADGSIAVGLFNLGELESEVTAEWIALGISGEHVVRDLWRQKDLGTFKDRFSSTVGRHGVVFVRISPRS
jgi:alpha-galactosidase